jgi:D-tyrosyl-tRNA(Tyr) deacylase
MILVLQRVQKASVIVEQKEIASIQKGILAYVGVEKEDSETDILLAAKKISGLRIFEDDAGKMSLSAAKEDSFLLISQFTLCGSIQKGFRPDFTNAQQPDTAKQIFDQLCTTLQTTYHRKVKTGIFGEDMQIHSQVDGPVTIYFQTRKGQ